MYCNCSISFPKLESPQHIRIFLFDRNMLYSILSCKLLLVLSWETGFETKLDCEILQDCTPVVLWGKKKDTIFTFLCGQLENITALFYSIYCYSSFFLVDELEEKKKKKLILNHYFQDYMLLATR